MASPIALLAGAAQSTLQGALNYGVQEYTNSINWHRQRALNEQNYQRYLEQRNYDNPLSQMTRLRAAGINPALYFSGNGMSSSSPAPMASGYNDVAPQMSGSPIASEVLNLLMQKAQIDNINADTQQKKEVTKATEIKNEVDAMTKDAFQFAVDSGLYQDAVNAGFLQQKEEGRRAAMQTMEAAWNTAIYLGTSISSVLSEVDSKGRLHRVVDINEMEIPFEFSQKDFDKASQQFVGGRDAQIMANNAAKLMSELYMEKQQKDIDIYKKLNEMAKSGTWYEKAIANVALVSLFISQERFSLPSIGLTIDKGAKNTTINKNDD